MEQEQRKSSLPSSIRREVRKVRPDVKQPKVTIISNMDNIASFAYGSKKSTKSEPSQSNSVQFGDGNVDKCSVRVSVWNVNGLKAVLKKGQMQEYIDKYNPDIVCFNETKVSEILEEKEEVEKLFPSDYSLFLNCCKIKRYYSGVGIATKYKPLNITHNMGVPELDKEGRVLTMEFAHFVVVVCYTPNAGDKGKRLDYRVNHWDPAFRQYVKELKQQKRKPLIVCGDLNVAHSEIDLYDPDGNRGEGCFTVEERENLSKLLDVGFYDVYRKLHPTKVGYTHWTMKRADARVMDKGWRLDYMLLTKESLKQVQEVVVRADILGSDHCPVEISLKLPEEMKSESNGTLDAQSTQPDDESSKSTSAGTKNPS